MLNSRLDPIEDAAATAAGEAFDAAIEAAADIVSLHVDDVEITCDHELQQDRDGVWTDGATVTIRTDLGRPTAAWLGDELGRQLFAAAYSLLGEAGTADALRRERLDR